VARVPLSGRPRPITGGLLSGNERLQCSLFAPRPARSTPLDLERCAQVLGTVQEISKASPDLDGCQKLLGCVADELRAEQGVLILSNPLTRELEFVVYNQDPCVPKLYADYYCDLDPTGLPDYVRGRTPLPRRPPAYMVSDLMDVVDYSSLLSTEFYNDFFRSARIHYDIVALVSPNADTHAALCLHRARTGKPFSPDEVTVLEMIAPFVGNHLERMFAASLRSALEAGPGEGIIVCDTSGRVLYCNETARSLCASQGRLGTLGLTVEASFVGYALSRPEVLTEVCDADVSSREVTLEHGAAGRVITLEPPPAPGLGWAQPLKDRFGLSQREVEVLDRLMTGASNKEISQALFIAECTVKKHVHSIATKIGVRSRASIAHAVRKELGAVR